MNASFALVCGLAFESLPARDDRAARVSKIVGQDCILLAGFQPACFELSSPVQEASIISESSEETMYCQSCGSPIESSAGFCGSCGSAQRIEAAPGVVAPSPAAYTVRSNVKSDTRPGDLRPDGHRDDAGQWRSTVPASRRNHSAAPGSSEPPVRLPPNLDQDRPLVPPLG